MCKQRTAHYSWENEYALECGLVSTMTYNYHYTTRGGSNF